MFFLFSKPVERGLKTDHTLFERVSWVKLRNYLPRPNYCKEKHQHYHEI